MRNRNHNAMMRFPVAPPGAMMSISFESEEIIFEKHCVSGYAA
jgi:hypothetical protein